MKGNEIIVKPRSTENSSEDETIEVIIHALTTGNVVAKLPCSFKFIGVVFRKDYSGPQFANAP